jgi:hypothetical protein
MGGGAGGSAGGAAGGAAGSTAVPGAAAAQAGRRGGIALDLRRGKSSRERLAIDWTYPVWKPAPAEPKPGQTTVVVEKEHALAAADAYALAAADDRRPLLVLRECDRCRGTDHALLARDLDNEQTVLLTHWFHCVKAPVNVLEDEHPLRALFAPAKPGERIPHLFFADADGGNRAPLPGDQSQNELWDVMFSFLDRCYDGDAKKAVREMRSLLSQFDRLDGQEAELRGRIDQEIEKRGPGSEKLAKYEADLQKLQKERELLQARERRIRALALVALQEPAPAGPARR